MMADSLLFNGVTRDDAGTYICRAESEEGVAEIEVRLLIEGKNVMLKNINFLIIFDFDVDSILIKNKQMSTLMNHLHVECYKQ